MIYPTQIHSHLRESSLSLKEGHPFLELEFNKEQSNLVVIEICFFKVKDWNVHTRQSALQVIQKHYSKLVSFIRE